ncbi:MAG TPA: hypothetical protein H9867_06535 [Candidatus Corynebacterium gallistercoris]|uniref:histidine kinase n=1 Tax=Candidatus Corynebacterium gallistercoris TaxID=2838530 RepID=A0A9D1URB1_9CORY|nr:hypothetical protein [Candidatus Corynebacterium gallistercoris]
MDSQGIPADRPAAASTRPRRFGAGAWTLLICFCIVGLNFLLSSQPVQPAAVAFGLALSLFLAAGVAYPLLATPFFLVAFGAATVSSFGQIPTISLMAPAFCGVIAYSGRRWLTVAVVAYLAAWGVVDPTADVPGVFFHSLDPVALIIWGLMIGVATAIGYFLGAKDRQRHDLVEEWQRDLQHKQRQLANMLHDSVASSLTSVVMRSEALSLQLDPEFGGKAPSTPELRETLEFVAEEGRNAATDLRELLAALTAADWHAPGRPAPGVPEAVERAVALLKHHGFSVQFREDTAGELLNAREFTAALPSGSTQRMLLHRALLEGATNILKYAQPGSTVEFAVAPGRRAVSVFLRNLCREDAAANSTPTQATAVNRPALAFMSSGLGLENLEQWAKRAKGRAVAKREGKDLWVLRVDIPR